MNKVYLLYLKYPGCQNGAILIDVFKDKSVAEGFINSKVPDMALYLIIEEREVRQDI